MYAISMWNWTDMEAVRNLGIMQTAGGFVALATYGSFAYKLGKMYVKVRYAFNITINY